VVSAAYVPRQCFIFGRERAATGTNIPQRQPGFAYGGDATQIATNGALAAFASTPHDTWRSPR